MPFKQSDHHQEGPESSGKLEKKKPSANSAKRRRSQQPGIPARDRTLAAIEPSADRDRLLLVYLPLQTARCISARLSSFSSAKPVQMTHTPRGSSCMSAQLFTMQKKNAACRKSFRLRWRRPQKLHPRLFGTQTRSDVKVWNCIDRRLPYKFPMKLHGTTIDQSSRVGIRNALARSGPSSLLLGY